MPEKDKLEFPRVWEYKVIAVAKSGVRGEIVSILKNRGISAEIVEGRKSRQGAYRTFSFQVYVQSKKQMRDLGNDIACCNRVKMVL
ncbi:MAG: HP0495 family protein [Thermodesulfobacteriota bacterium]